MSDDLCSGVGAPVTGHWGDTTPCPVCGRNSRIRKSGDIGAHPAKRDATVLPLLALVYRGQGVGKRRHLIVTATGAEPGPGVGWHTVCGAYWADGKRTSEGGWGFRWALYLLPCENCKRRAK